MVRHGESLFGELGLRTRWDFATERAFYVALCSAPLFLMVLGVVVPTWNDGIRLQPSLLLSIVLWQPLVEELLFRGVIQGQAGKRAWGRRMLGGASIANIATSCLFTAMHLISHPPAWALAVLVPSLVFGYFRDRYGHILPSFLLHAAFNASYLLVGAFATSA